MVRPILGPDEFTTAFARHGRALWVLAAAWVGREEAMDLVQETARLAWQQRDRFELGSDARAWLAQIARHLGANWRRRRRPTAVGPDLLPDPPAPTVVPTVAPADAARGAAGADELGCGDELAAGLAGLSEVARACLMLHVVTELSFAEVSNMLAIPENTVASHVRRARLMLRDSLGARRPVGEVR
ncbi:MAG: RNA polymerase sigma factor [Planctomycetes bacterium]|nr:RNA polymerase sigma factor [Planctomycetota bacterium]